MDPLSIVYAIIRGSQLLFVAVSRAQSHQHQCKRLQTRLSCILPSLQQLSATQQPNNSNEAALQMRYLRTHQQTLEALLQWIDACSRFVIQLSGEGYLLRLIKSYGYHQAFMTYNNQLNGLILDLQLDLSIQHLFNAEQDRLDALADAADLSAKQEEILQQIRRVEQDQLQREGKRVLLAEQRYLSQKLRLQEIIHKMDHMMIMQSPHATTPSPGTSPPPASILLSSPTPPSTDPTAAAFRSIPFCDLLPEEKIGSGSFGDVYRGTWISTDTTIAMKLLKNTGSNNPQWSQELEEEFKREVAIMHSLHYEHVVNVLGACTEPGSYCIVMEYIANGSLYHYFNHGLAQDWSWLLRCQIAYQMVKSINFLHQQNPMVLHGDIKSMNFLLDNKPFPTVKVCDFGLARLRHHNAELWNKYTYNDGNTFRGSLAWSAPEQLIVGKNSKRSRYDEKCDVYSLGMVLWELVTEQLPYECDSMEVVRSAVLAGERLEIPAHVPAYFHTWITMCWSHRSTDRPTCRQLLNLIKQQIEILQHTANTSTPAAAQTTLERPVLVSPPVTPVNVVSTMTLSPMIPSVTVVTHSSSPDQDVRESRSSVIQQTPAQQSPQQLPLYLYNTISAVPSPSSPNTHASFIFPPTAVTTPPPPIPARVASLTALLSPSSSPPSPAHATAAAASTVNSPSSQSPSSAARSALTKEQEQQVLSSLHTHSSVSHLVIIMKKYPDSPSVQLKACQLLQQFCQSQTDDGREAAAHTPDGIACVVCLLTRHVSDIHLIDTALSVLALLADVSTRPTTPTSSQARKQRCQLIVDTGGLEALVALLSSRHTSLPILIKSLSTLNKLYVVWNTPPNAVILIRSQVCTTLMQLMQTHDDAYTAMITECCFAWQILLKGKEVRGHFVSQLQGIEWILALMASHMTSPLLQSCGCWMLHILCRTATTAAVAADDDDRATTTTTTTRRFVQQSIYECDGLYRIVCAMKQHPHDARVQAYACEAWVDVCGNDDDDNGDDDQNKKKNENGCIVLNRWKKEKQGHQELLDARVCMEYAAKRYASPECPYITQALLMVSNSQG